MQQLLLGLNKKCKIEHRYSDLLLQSREQAFEYSIAAGEEVYSQFNGFNDFKGKVILDFGCGGGGKALAYARHGASRVIAVDIGQDFSVAREYAAGCGLSVEFMNKGIDEPLAVQDGSIDIVISSSVMEHVKDVEGALRDIRRVLKQDGLFLNRWHPFRSRYGSHIKDGIGLPYAHLFFSEADVMRCYCKALEERFSCIPGFFKKLHSQSVSYDDLDFHLNRYSLRRMRASALAAGFKMVQRRYFIKGRQVQGPRFLPEMIRDYFLDYEVSIYRI